MFGWVLWGRFDVDFEHPALILPYTTFGNEGWICERDCSNSKKGFLKVFWPWFDKKLSEKTGHLITSTACSQFSSEEKIKSSQRIGYSVPRRVEESGGTSGGA